MQEYDILFLAFKSLTIFSPCRLAGWVFVIACFLSGTVAGFLSQRNRHLAGGRLGLPYHSINQQTVSSPRNGSSGSPHMRLQGSGRSNLGFKASDDGKLAGTGWQQWGGPAAAAPKTGSNSSGLLGAGAAARLQDSSGFGRSGLGARKANGSSSSSVDMQGWNSSGDGWDDTWDDLERGIDNGASNGASNGGDGHSAVGVGMGSASGSSSSGVIGLGSAGNDAASPRRNRPLLVGRNQSVERDHLQASSSPGRGSVGLQHRDNTTWQTRRKSGDSDFEEW